MRRPRVIGIASSVVLVGTLAAWSAMQTPQVRAVDEHVVREYLGAYQWGPDEFVYLQILNEFSGTNQLAALDESGEVRTLYRSDRDRFFTGPGTALQTPLESRIEFHRDDNGKIVSLTWQREGTAPRVARRAATEVQEEVTFSSGDVQLAGTLFLPARGTQHPAAILVHGSGPATRDQILPFARFLVRRGMAILAYDKRGVGGSSGDWFTASFQDLATDVVAAFDYLKTRRDIDSTQVGLLGVSQAGWIMPIAAVRARDLAFLISVSGAAVPGTETTIDHAEREMTAQGMKPQTIADIIEVMKLQYHYARTGDGWAEYTAARSRLASRLGKPPSVFPATPDDRYWDFMRRLYFYDPEPTLRQLQVPVLALFGELDNNILPDKNTAAWDAALKAAGNRDYTLHVLPKANHLLLEATVGNNAEMPSLQRFVPGYFTSVHDWLAKRVRGFRGSS